MLEMGSFRDRLRLCRVEDGRGRLRREPPPRFPSPSSTNNLLGWVLPPLVICAVEAHPVTAFFKEVLARD